MATKLRKIHLLGVVAPIALAAGACGDSTMEPNAGTSKVGIQFAAVAPVAMSQSTYAPLSSHAGGPLVVEGTNGTLQITSVHLIISEFELDRVGANCDEVEVEDACEEFEAPPSFLDLPLSGETALAVSQEIPLGTYSELDFEIEDLEVDDDDGAKAQEIQTLMSQIRAEFTDWPDNAAALVAGTFAPTGGQPVAFRTYLKAEIEIELAFDPHMEITETSANKSVTVQIDPAAWFSFGDGTVLNLAEYDYDATGELLEFEVEIENGFTKIEHEDDD